MQVVQLSIIMPTYNSVAFIDRTMDSLLHTFEGTDSEIICIDDGSQDATLSRLQEYAQDYDQLHIIAHEHMGVSAARNAGLKLARGKYVVFVDSDDLFTADFYPVFLKQLKKNPDIILEDVQGIKDECYQERLTEKERLEAMKINLRFGSVSLSWGIGSRIYKRSFLLEKQLVFDPQIVVSEDMLFIMEAIAQANSLLLSPCNFYELQESHTLFHFNERNRDSELLFRSRVQGLLKQFHYPLARDINNRTKLTGFIFLIDSYYGPLYAEKKLSLTQAASELHQIATQYFYDTAFPEKKFDRYLSRKAPVYRQLLSHRQYRSVLVLNRTLDKFLHIQR